MLDLLDTNPTEGASVDPWAVPQPPRPKVIFLQRGIYCNIKVNVLLNIY